MGLVIGLVTAGVAGAVGYVVTYVNKLTDRIVELEKEIIRIKCKLNEE